MPLGPVALALLAAAMVFAFLRARYEQKARQQRTFSSESDEEGRPRLADRVELTPEGERYRERSRRYRRLFYASGLGALIATWFGV